MKSPRRTAVLVTSAAVALSGAAVTAVELAPASAATASHTRPSVVATGGVTVLALDAGTAQALSTNGISVAQASEARAGAAGIAFPIQAGVLDPSNLAGLLRHVGGLTFTAGGKSLTIRDFTVSTTSSKLSAYVDEVRGRITVLDLDLAQAKVAAGAGTLGVSGITASLDATAATALNQYFGTTLFAAGLAIGTVQVSAVTSTYYR